LTGQEIVSRWAGKAELMISAPFGIDRLIYPTLLVPPIEFDFSLGRMEGYIAGMRTPSTNLLYNFCLLSFVKREEISIESVPHTT
jgi:hypothetical protein